MQGEGYAVGAACLAGADERAESLAQCDHRVPGGVEQLEEDSGLYAALGVGDERLLTPGHEGGEAVPAGVVLLREDDGDVGNAEDDHRVTGFGEDAVERADPQAGVVVELLLDVGVIHDQPRALVPQDLGANTATLDQPFWTEECHVVVLREEERVRGALISNGFRERHAILA